MKLKTSIATVSIAGDLRDKLNAIAAAGFDGVEIFENDFLTYDASPSEVGKMVRDLGMEITLFQPFRDFEGMPEPFRSRNFERAERKFELMKEMGTDLMLICSNVSPASLGGIDRAADDLRELGEHASKHGLRVGFEALAWGRHIWDHRDAWEIVRRANHPNIGIILDSFHTLARKIDVNSIRAIPGDRIFIVQLADAPVIDMDLLYWSRHFRNMPGEGDLPVTGFMRAVAATGYNGPLSLEIFNDQFRGGSATAIARDGHRSLICLMDQVSRAESDIAIEVAEMPDRIDVQAVAFLEFAASEEEEAKLSALLKTFGFNLAGRHRSKEARLYKQGAINIVINTENQGYVSSYHAVRGLGAYAVGLRVDDASDAISRANALGVKLFEQPAAPGEVQLKGIEGVGGSIIYFLDESEAFSNIWEREFVLESPSASDDTAGLTHVDHIAETMAYEEMLTWLLFYTSIFNMNRAPMVDVVDPGGLVRSQAVQNGEGTLRLTLNGAENRRTFAGRFIAESFGSGFQHLAFASADIFKTAKALEELGFKCLNVPENYYDDLEARFGLDPDFADRLRQHKILYDRDDKGGEFFQIYSTTLGEGFFFEIVERRGAYAGYGALNAPFRIAAQRRAERATLSLDGNRLLG
ncbi:bifunctional sugar phosphate isomerase/epimerase/4-hydroxyphenylpyruvate dioxygenase family protein [Rhizobium sp. L1K21]|uniref:bifunctional sugar phosphate isomerase/epimerase/4-hydroxyphenylpyruvate dioxygenase family protein n=1 Tax=Rhizobium sp. L1K21 TaxID=2954933 RepID=UPI0020935529|nr:sugar phosphate isomerase/epimerase and 4-hydroxyphenylpyruvate domain-containing protein [Rhizobium sp. L1K21]MCO6187893.1 sugar phosphate isomerase/epimerase and 4-hydroxyphenylpyruvate domain-containing protein [Rhizobium sp. L1K21]